MSRRALIVVAVAALVVAGGVVLLVRGGGDGGSKDAGGDRLARALAYAPASAEVVAALDVAPGSAQGRAVRDLARTFPAARFAADSARSALTSLGFDTREDPPRVLAGPIVLAGPSAAIGRVVANAGALRLDVGSLLSAGAVVALSGRSADDVGDAVKSAVDDGRLRRLGALPGGVAQYALPGDGGGRMGVRQADIVLAADAAKLTEAVALHDRRGGLTRRAFEARLGPLRGPALLHLVALPRVLIGDRARDVPFVKALRGGALAISVRKPGLRLQAHLATDPTGLRPQDLPLAPGAAPPSPAPGRARLSAGVRDLGQTIRVLDAVKDDLKIPVLKSLTEALGTLDSVKGPLKTFGRIDVDAALIDQLTGTTTITQEADGIALRAELRDGGPLRTALNRIAAVPDFAIDLANITDLDLDKAGDEAYEVRRDGRTFLRVAVLGTTLVVTSDLTAGLRAIAARRPQRADRPGALAFRAQGIAIQDLIIKQLGLPPLARLVLGGFGDFHGSARAELSGVDLDATLALAS